MAFSGWVSFLEMLRRNRALVVRTMTRWLHTILSSAFEGWARRTKSKRQMRVLNVWRSARVQNIFETKKENQLLFRILLSWKVVVAGVAIRNTVDTSVQWFRRNMLHTSLPSVFFKWFGAVRDASNLSGKMTAYMHEAGRARAAKTFISWVMLVRQKRTQLRKIISHMRKGNRKQLAKTLSAWIAFVANHIRVHKGRMKNCLQKVTKKRLSQRVASWRMWATSEKVQKRKVNRLVLRRQQISCRHVLISWWRYLNDRNSTDTVMCAHNTLARCINSLLVIDSWLSFPTVQNSDGLEDSRAIRHSILGNSAALVQLLESHRVNTNARQEELSNAEAIIALHRQQTEHSATEIMELRQAVEAMGSQGGDKDKRIQALTNGLQLARASIESAEIKTTETVASMQEVLHGLQEEADEEKEQYRRELAKLRDSYSELEQVVVRERSARTEVERMAAAGEAELREKWSRVNSVYAEQNRREGELRTEQARNAELVEALSALKQQHTQLSSDYQHAQDLYISEQQVAQSLRNTISNEGSRSRRLRELTPSKDHQALEMKYRHQLQLESKSQLSRAAHLETQVAQQRDRVDALQTEKENLSTKLADALEQLHVLKTDKSTGVVHSRHAEEVSTLQAEQARLEKLLAEKDGLSGKIVDNMQLQKRRQNDEIERVRGSYAERLSSDQSTIKKLQTQNSEVLRKLSSAVDKLDQHEHQVRGNETTRCNAERTQHASDIENMQQFYETKLKAAQQEVVELVAAQRAPTEAVVQLDKMVKQLAAERQAHHTQLQQQEQLLQQQRWAAEQAAISQRVEFETAVRQEREVHSAALAAAEHAKEAALQRANHAPAPMRYAPAVQPVEEALRSADAKVQSVTEQLKRIMSESEQIIASSSGR